MLLWSGTRVVRGHAAAAAPRRWCRHLRRGRTLIAAAALLLAGTISAQAALSILPGRPGSKPTPRPTGTPLVAGTKGACQEQIRGASATLASAVRASLAGCLATAMPCVLDRDGDAACCGAAAPACVARSEEIAAAGGAFVADVVAPPCSTLPFADLESEAGLDFGGTYDACLRLEPPVSVDGLGSLATCLERLVTEDVLHLAATVEQPRALEALVCMDLEDRFPGVLREHPATCEALPEATPTPVPTPTPVATATPGTSPGLSPTPAGSPGSATPTPGGATPTPQPTAGGSTCTQADVTIVVNYSAGDFPDVAGITVSLKYPASVGIPGFGGEDSVKQRVTNLSGVSGGLFNVGDQDADGQLNIGLISIASTIPPGSFARVRFDCASGASLPAAGAFTCTVDASTSDGNAVSPSQCVLTVAAP